MGRKAEPITRSSAMYYTYIVAIMNGVLLPTDAVLREAEEALAVAEQSGGNVDVGQGRQYLGIILVRMGGSSRARGFQLLDQVRAMAVEKRYIDNVASLVDIHVGQEKIRTGDFAGAISLAQPAANELFRTGDRFWDGYATNVLVEALLRRGSPADLQDAKVAVDRLAAAPVEPRFRCAQHLAPARTGAARSGTWRRQLPITNCETDYRKMATDLGFEGHMAMAEAMP